MGINFSSIFLVIASFYIASTTFVHVEAQRKSFGELCDHSMKCDKRAWLTCRNGTCDCIKPDVMLYDKNVKKCASKAGERCQFVLKEFDDDDKNVIMEVIDCAQNSVCGPDGFCTCQSKFYEGSYGTCIPAQSHLQKCSSQIKCSAFEGLTCQDGVCRCNGSISIYSQRPGHCVGLAGEPCVNSKCIDNATCSRTLPLPVCQCNPRYYQDDEKKCREKIRIFGGCTKDDQCMFVNGSQLVCDQGQCNCDPQISRFGSALKSVSFKTYIQDRDLYGENTVLRLQGDYYSQCLGLADFPCLDRMCVPSATCEYSDSGSHIHQVGTCRCLPSYQKSGYGTCAQDFGRSCEAFGSCLDGLRCDLTQRLCQCPYSDQEYDSWRKMCMSLVDGPCNSSMVCTPDAECRIFSVGPPAPKAGHCACKKGFVKNSEGKCDIAFGQPCTHNTHSRCDSIAGLGCFDELCQCKPFSQYSEKDRRCLGLVGAGCDLNVDETQCVEGSKCAQIHPRLGGVCSCLLGFQETSKFTCEILTTTPKSGVSHDEE